MSNPGNDIDIWISTVIEKISKAQSDLAVYTTILGQLYRAQDADRSNTRHTETLTEKPTEDEPLASDPIESFESIEFDESFAFVPAEYRQYLAAREEKQKNEIERERLENSTRIQYLTTCLNELRANENAARKEEEEDRKPAARPPGWKPPSDKVERFRQARLNAQQWAEHRKPNPNVWCSPANQKAIRERKEKVKRQLQVENRQAQYAASKRAAASAKSRARHLDSVIEEFERAQQRAATSPSREEIKRIEGIPILPHPSFDTDSGEGDY